MSEEAGWSELNRYREQIQNRYPSIWDLPIVPRSWDQIRSEVQPHDRVLDIGASQRLLEEYLRTQGFVGPYASMDIDRSTVQDWYSLEEIRGTFDVVALLEVIEHVPAGAGLDMMATAFRVLRPGGKFIVSTPNIYHPTTIHVDAGHVTAYSYAELGARALRTGFSEIRLYRVCQTAPLKWRIARRILGPTVNKYLGIDYAPGVLLVCSKPEDTSRSE